MADVQKYEWIEWNGGKCPVGHDVIVEVKFKDWLGMSGFKAGELDWEHSDDGGDIIAYRVVEMRSRELEDR